MSREYERLAAWREAIHLELLNAAVQLAISSTTNADSARELTRKLRRQPWYESIDATVFFAPTGLRYMGELLERYREKYGEERKHYRAVALALAISLPCAEDSMFIGSQRRNFMKRLQQDAQSDLYLQCALYILEPAMQKELYDSIVGQKHADPAALLFSLAFLPEDTFSRMSGQLDQLLFQERKLPVYGNSGIYAAFLQQYGEEIGKSHAKGFAPLKALLALSRGYVRPGSKQDTLLQSYGYTRQEIICLNAGLQWERSLTNTLSLDGIPAEKMAMECVTVVLNAPTKQNEHLMKFLQMLLCKYTYFEVKIEGKHGLWDAIKDDLHPCCPQTVAWMVKHISERFDYAFDVLDPQWDILPALISKEEYHTLFRQQIVREEDKGFTHLLAMLAQYEKLTGTHYGSFFDSYDWEEQGTFNALVDVGIIKLSDYFTKHQSERDNGYNNRSCLHYVISYAKNVPTRPAFEFWQWFFAEHTVRDFPKFFSDSVSFDSELVKEFHAYYGVVSSYTMKLEREFLTEQEQRQLYEWIDESYFCFHPDKYAGFQAYSLSHSEICALYTLEERRETFSVLLATKPKAVSDSLKRLYYTEDEKKREAEAEEKRKEQTRLKEIENAKEEWKVKIAEKYDGTMASVVKITDHAWRHQTLLAEQLMPIVKERLEKSQCQLDKAEIVAFLTLCGFFFKYLPVEWAHIQTMIGKLQEVIPDDSGSAAANAGDA